MSDLTVDEVILRPCPDWLDEKCLKCGDPEGFADATRSYRKFAMLELLEWSCRSCGYAVASLTADGSVPFAALGSMNP